MNRSIIILSAAAFGFLAECARDKSTDRFKAETGRGTFVSAKGDSITAIYHAGGSVRSYLPDKTEAELFSAVSASGARYTNNIAEWWEHQGEATCEIDGKLLFRGKITTQK